MKTYSFYIRYINGTSNVEVSRRRCKKPELTDDYKLVERMMSENHLIGMCGYVEVEASPMTVCKSKHISFEDKQIQALNKRFKMLHVRHQTNTFFIELFNKLNKNKKLSAKQFAHLKHVFDTGLTMYESNLFSVRY